MPETSLVEFSSHSTELASVEVGDVFGKRYTTEKGIVVEWAPYQVGRQVWQLGLPPGGRRSRPDLPFVSIWRTTVTPAAQMACTIETAPAGDRAHRRRPAVDSWRRAGRD